MAFCLVLAKLAYWACATFKWSQRDGLNRRLRLLCAIVVLIVVSCYAARTVSRNQDWQSAESLYFSSLKLYPNHEIALNGLGKQYYHNQQYDKARPFLEALGDDEDGLYLLGKIAMTEGRSVEALDLFFRLTEQHPFHIGNNELALLLWQMGNKEAAEMRFLKANSAPILVNSLEKIALLNNIGCMALYRHNNIRLPNQLAKDMFDQFVQTHELKGSMAATLSANLASVYFREGVLDKANAFYEQAGRLDPAKFQAVEEEFKKHLASPMKHSFAPECTMALSP